MKPLTPNQRAAKALTAMREAIAQPGATTAQIIAAGELAAGGDEAARIAGAIWGNKFLVMGSN